MTDRNKSCQHVHLFHSCSYYSLIHLSLYAFNPSLYTFHHSIINFFIYSFIHIHWSIETDRHDILSTYSIVLFSITIYPFIHTSIHIFIQTDRHTGIKPVNISNTLFCISIHTFIHTSIHMFIHSFTHLDIQTDRNKSCQ